MECRSSPAPTKPTRMDAPAQLTMDDDGEPELQTQSMTVSSYRYLRTTNGGEDLEDEEMVMLEETGDFVPPPPHSQHAHGYLREASVPMMDAEENSSTASTSNSTLIRDARPPLDEDDDDGARLSPLPTDKYGFITSRLDLKQQIEPIVLPASLIRKREGKWLEMLDNWPQFMNTKFDKVRSRCRKGVPPALRGKAWKFLSGAAFHMETDASRTAFEELDALPGDPKWNEDIRKDLDRQFPEHELFSKSGPYGKSGQGDLYRLLKAYTVLHPEEGYCQGQAPVGAVLLMHLPLADAFYVFVQVCHKYLPGYYSAGLEHIQLDGAILQELLRHKLPATYRHLKKQSVEPALYMIEWFMCVFCRSLPWSTVLRVWDMFFCEGVKILFKVALVIFKYTLGSKDQIRECPGMMEIVEKLRKLPPTVTNEAFLTTKILDVRLDERDLEMVHHSVLRKREKARKKAEKQRRQR